MMGSLYDGIVQSMDANTGIITCIIPSLFGKQPQQLPPSLLRSTDVTRIAPVKGGDRVLCFSPGSDEAPLRWLPTVRDAAFDTFNDARYVNVTGDTMSGGLTVSAGGLTVSGGNLSVGSSGQIQLNSAGEALRFQGGSGEYIAWFAGATRTGYLQANGASGLILNSEQGPLTLGSSSGAVNINSSLNAGVPSVYGSTYNGLNWGGNYLIMTDGANTFVSAPSGTVFLRAGTNGSYSLNLNASGTHGMVGHLGMGGYDISGIGTATAAQYNTPGIFYCSNGGGGWYMTDGTYIRSYSNKTIYVNGNMWADGGEVRAGNGSAGRFACNRGGGAWYYERAFQADNNGARVGYSLLPGGYAVQIDEQPSNPNMNLLNTDGSGYCDVFGGAYTNASQRRLKQDIQPWPLQPRSLGAAANVETAWEKLHKIDIVSYRVKQEIHLRTAMGERREKALQRLNSLHASKDRAAYPPPFHQCGVNDRNSPFDCGGTPENPCVAYRNWERQRVGVTVEQLVQVLPEAVVLDNDGVPGGVDVTAALFAVVRALQDLHPDLPGVVDRVEAMETRLSALEPKTG